ncbi:hypothetical protein [Erythrobacter sp.]|nr:hypothetical protein [Erythrobacter sp.]
MDQPSKKEERRGSTLWVNLEACLIGAAAFGPGLVWLWAWLF